MGHLPVSEALARVPPKIVLAGRQCVAAHTSPSHALVMRLRLSLTVGLAVSPVLRWARPRDQRRCGRRIHAAAAVRRARTRVNPRLEAMTVRELRPCALGCQKLRGMEQSRRWRQARARPRGRRTLPQMIVLAFSHVMTADENRSAVERANLPLSRAELDRAHAGLWTATVASMYNRSSYRPAPPKLVQRIKEDDVQGIDPYRHM